MKKGRGSQVVVNSVEIRAVEGFDNRGVIVANTFTSAQPVSIIETWDRKLKRKVLLSMH